MTGTCGLLVGVSCRGAAENASEGWCAVLQVARAANRQLLELPSSWQSRDTEAVLAVVSNELGSEQEQTRLDALHWVHVLLGQDRTAVSPYAWACPRSTSSVLVLRCILCSAVPCLAATAAAVTGQGFCCWASTPTGRVCVGTCQHVLRCGRLCGTCASGAAALGSAAAGAAGCAACTLRACGSRGPGRAGLHCG